MQIRRQPGTVIYPGYLIVIQKQHKPGSTTLPVQDQILPEKNNPLMIEPLIED
jgi:hypothetical protein